MSAFVFHCVAVDQQCLIRLFTLNHGIIYYSPIYDNILSARVTKISSFFGRQVIDYWSTVQHLRSKPV